MYAQQWLCLLPARGRPSLSLPSGGGRPSGNRTSCSAIAANSRSWILDRLCLQPLRTGTLVKYLLVALIAERTPAVVTRKMSTQGRSPRKRSVMWGVGGWNGYVRICSVSGKGPPGLSCRTQSEWWWLCRIPLRERGRRLRW